MHSLFRTELFDVVVALESNIFGNFSHQSTILQYIERSPIEVIVIVEIIGNHSNVDEILCQNTDVWETGHQKYIWSGIPPTTFENSKVSDYEVECNIVKAVVQAGCQNFLQIITAIILEMTKSTRIMFGSMTAYQISAQFARTCEWNSLQRNNISWTRKCSSFVEHDGWMCVIGVCCVDPRVPVYYSAD